MPSKLDGKYELTVNDTALFLWLFRTESFVVYLNRGLIADGTYLRLEQQDIGSIEFQPDASIVISGASGGIRLRFSDSSKSSLLYLNWLTQGIHALACLDGVKGPYDGQSFPLKKGSTTIGRTEGDIRLPEDHAISDPAARIVYSEEQKRFVLHVEHSLNDVSLNGKKLFRGQKTILSDQDMIQMGKSVFRLTDGMGMKKQ